MFWFDSLKLRFVISNMNMLVSPAETPTKIVVFYRLYFCKPTSASQSVFLFLSFFIWNWQNLNLVWEFFGSETMLVKKAKLDFLKLSVSVKCFMVFTVALFLNLVLSTVIISSSLLRLHPRKWPIWNVLRRHCLCASYK